MTTDSPVMKTGPTTVARAMYVNPWTLKNTMTDMTAKNAIQARAGSEHTPTIPAKSATTG